MRMMTTMMAIMTHQIRHLLPVRSRVFFYWSCSLASITLSAASASSSSIFCKFWPYRLVYSFISCVVKLMSYMRVTKLSIVSPRSWSKSDIWWAYAYSRMLHKHIETTYEQWLDLSKALQPISTYFRFIASCCSCCYLLPSCSCPLPPRGTFLSSSSCC